MLTINGEIAIEISVNEKKHLIVIPLLNSVWSVYVLHKECKMWKLKEIIIHNGFPSVFNPITWLEEFLYSPTRENLC